MPVSFDAVHASNSGVIDAKSAWILWMAAKQGGVAAELWSLLEARDFGVAQRLF